jgi:hypothetical protein
MTTKLRASTGATIVVWRDGENYHSRIADAVDQPQICLGIDLFEVIAELSGLNLDNEPDANEAVALSEWAQRQLDDGGADRDGEDDVDEPALRPD